MPKLKAPWETQKKRFSACNKQSRSANGDICLFTHNSNTGIGGVRSEGRIGNYCGWNWAALMTPHNCWPIGNFYVIRKRAGTRLEIRCCQTRFQRDCCESREICITARLFPLESWKTS